MNSGNQNNQGQDKIKIELLDMKLVMEALNNVSNHLNKACTKGCFDLQESYKIVTDLGVIGKAMQNLDKLQGLAMDSAKQNGNVNVTENE